MVVDEDSQAARESEEEATAVFTIVSEKMVVDQLTASPGAKQAAASDVRVNRIVSATESFPHKPPIVYKFPTPIDADAVMVDPGDVNLKEFEAGPSGMQIREHVELNSAKPQPRVGPPRGTRSSSRLKRAAASRTGMSPPAKRLPVPTLMAVDEDDDEELSSLSESPPPVKKSCKGKERA